MMLEDAANWPHRFDLSTKSLNFIHVPRRLHADCTFITDEHLPSNLPVTNCAMDAIEQRLPEQPAPVHFVFHSAYCCSTMIARALDLPGIAMGLKEPQILNDLLGASRRGLNGDEFRKALDVSLTLLGRTFQNGETNVVKPSNIANPLAELILELRPDTRALLLYAPIDSYLKSIAKKGMWGRRWVRQVIISTIEDGMLIGGFEGQNLLELTDLQVAAIGWLSQHALFTRLQSRFGESRIRTLDSVSLLADQSGVMRQLVTHFQLRVPNEQFIQMMNGPAFTTHSKDSSVEFDSGKRDQEQADMAEIHGEEIDMVAQWTQAVAQSQGLSLSLPGALLV
ncbi:hypothetical protein ACRAQ7_01755 [Erythrobacter sp. W53]|uniref:hypothetical protein n=1 Tax=Erythrobacter sp. W53 TaxID=3425947 RepID=UPI003D76A3CF